MQNLTKNIGKSGEGIKIHEKAKINKILISRPNHRLGNLLLLSPLVEEVVQIFPDCKIDLFVKGSITPIIYKNYENINNTIQLPKKPFGKLGIYFGAWLRLRSGQYDLAINANYGSSSGRLSILFSRAKIKFFGESNERLSKEFSDYKHDAKKCVYNLRNALVTTDFALLDKKIPNLNLKIDNQELEIGKERLKEITRNDRESICLFTNATGEKCYSEKWWFNFYNQLKSAFPDYNIIELLPVENISKLNFTIPNFYSQDIREMGGFIANVSVFIAADNGVMHLSSSVGTPTVGLFSVTDENKYKPYNEKSFSINTNTTEPYQMIEQIQNLLS